MGRPFFRQLRAVLAPGGVLAVNYFGGKGGGLKQAWCRLRLEFESGESECCLWQGCTLQACSASTALTVLRCAV